MLSLLIWIPIAAGLILLVNKNTKLRNVIVVLTMALSLKSAIWLCFKFNQLPAGIKWQETVSWLPKFNINYALGITDGMSLLLILLTIVISSTTMLYTYSSKEKPETFFGFIFILQGLLTGVFAATDALLFYVFWEATLVPMFLLIGIFGRTNNVFSAIKFFLYTFFGSIFLLTAIIYLGASSHDFNIFSFYGLKLTLIIQSFLLLALLIAFTIKIPLWPLHSWLPDAHSAAPTAGSVILAALLLKIGAYGLIRFCLPMFSSALHYFIWPMIAISLITIIYIGLVALAQTNIKRLIAYSSIAHMGIVTLGIFAAILLASKPNLTALCLNGAIIQMISHALSISGLFFCAGILYQRFGSNEIKHFQGVAASMPILAAFFLFFSLATIGLPGTSGFVGEFFIILGVFHINLFVALIASLSLIISAGYMLWLFQRIFWGANSSSIAITDLNWREIMPLALLAGAILIIGCYPQIILRYLG